MAHILKHIFSSEGLFPQYISNYKPRKAQLLMAQKIEQCLQSPLQTNKTDKNNILLCEAGTGTGKTFAYLVPSILSGQQTIISTGTKNLQDQLFYKDIPLIKSVLEKCTEKQLNYSLLKGRSNYVCLYRFKTALQDGHYDEIIQQNLQSINNSLSRTLFADKTEFIDIAEQSPVWPIISSTAESCPGIHCSYYDDCYILKARKQAFLADIVIVNHHLLAAHLKLKADALGELLPSAETIIIDEAHQLPQIVSHFFSRQISATKIKRFLRESRKLAVQSAMPLDHFISLDKELKRIINDLYLVLKRYKQRGSWSEVRVTLTPLCNEIIFILSKLQIFFKNTLTECPEFEYYFNHSEQLLLDFSELTGLTPVGMIHWFECRNNSFTLHLTPLTIAHEFSQQLASSSSHWIFTSATLTIEPYSSIVPYQYPQITETHHHLFSHFAEQLSIKHFIAIKLESPFNFTQQAILFAPQSLPQPGENNYIPLLINNILPIIDWLEGKTFLLFTSYQALNEAKEVLQTANFNLFIQGSAPKQQLLNDFKHTKRAILLGTSSFWEGVDVKGSALSCVLIDKIPFASPYEPILQGKIQAMQQQGLNAFYHYQLPQAAMALKQGVGRLIRDTNDYGILIIADPRLFSKSYGTYLRKILPDMTIETDIQQLQAKFAAMCNQQLKDLNELPSQN